MSTSRIVKRVPGLTPASQDRLCRMLSSDDAFASLGEAAVRSLVDAVSEAMPSLAGAVPISTLVLRLQVIADELRREGRIGMAQDIDKLSGILFSSETAKAQPVKLAVAAGA